jgi:spore germination protein KB
LKKTIVLPLGVIQVVFSIILFGNIIELIEIVFEKSHLLLLSTQVILPLLLLLIAMMRGIKGENA